MRKGISIGADHGGFLLKEKIKRHLENKGYGVEDLGTISADPCDYPEVGFRAAKRVSRGDVGKAILICKTGIGMAIIANKLPGVRAGVCLTEKDAASSREHNDVNVLVLAAAKTPAGRALKITDTWLKTKALPGRHARRVKQIEALERKVFK